MQVNHVTVRGIPRLWFRSCPEDRLVHVHSLHVLFRIMTWDVDVKKRKENTHTHNYPLIMPTDTRHYRDKHNRPLSIYE